MLATLTSMEGESISALADVLQMERTTLTRNLMPLQKLGYVAIERGTDNRARALSLTKTGKAALATAEPMWRAAQRNLEKRLGKASMELLNATLDNTLDNLPVS